MTHHRLAFRQDCHTAGLTDRETDVLVAITEGRTYREAGEDLGISANTVRNHVASAMNRTGAGSVPELVTFVAYPNEKAA